MKWISIPYEEKLMLFPHSTYCSEGVADFDSLFKFVEGVTSFNISFRLSV